MSTNEFERRAAAWLADGPTVLRDPVLEEALREVHMTQQRRRLSTPWRFQPMLRYGVLAAALIVVVAGAILLGGGGRSSAPSVGATAGPPTSAPTSVAAATASPVPQATMPPLVVTYVSPSYGFTVSYPAGWTTTPGTPPWPFGKNLQHGNPVLDVITGPVGSGAARLVGASIALPDGMGIDGFRAFASPQGVPCKTLDALQQPLAIDGVAAQVTLDGCASLSSLHGLIWDVVLVTGGRGYDFTIDGVITASEAQAWLESIKLDPSSAIGAGPKPS